MAINKVVYGNSTLIDLTSDTVTSDKLIEGATAHDKSGSVITGIAPAVSNQNKSATPTRSTQILTADSGYTGLGTVTVNPIPPEYGLVTWNGSVLTIS